jgi:hypothetical protein
VWHQTVWTGSLRCVWSNGCTYANTLYISAIASADMPSRQLQADTLNSTQLRSSAVTVCYAGSSVATCQLLLLLTQTILGQLLLV